MKKVLLTSTLLLTSIACFKDHLKEYNNKLKKDLTEAQGEFSHLIKEFRELKKDGLSAISSIKESKLANENLKNLECCINELNNHLRSTRQDLITSYKRKKGLKLAGSLAILANNKRKSDYIQTILIEISRNCQQILDNNLSLEKKLEKKLENDILKLKKGAQHLFYIIAAHSDNENIKKENEKKAEKAKSYKKQVDLKKLLDSLKLYITQEKIEKVEGDKANLIILTEKINKKFEESKKYVDDSQIELNDDGTKELTEIDEEIKKDLNKVYKILINLPLPKIFVINDYAKMTVNLGNFLKVKEAKIIKHICSLADSLEDKEKLKALSSISKVNYNDFNKCIMNQIGIKEHEDMIQYLNGQKNLQEYKMKILAFLKDQSFKETLKKLENNISDVKDVERRLTLKDILDDTKLQLKKIKKEAQN